MCAIKTQVKTTSKGRVNFTDGHIEAIDFFYDHGNGIVEVYTKSGKYVVNPYVYETFDRMTTRNRFCKEIISKYPNSTIVHGYTEAPIDSIELIEKKELVNG